MLHGSYDVYYYALEIYSGHMFTLKVNGQGRGRAVANEFGASALLAVGPDLEW